LWHGIRKGYSIKNNIMRYFNKKLTRNKQDKMIAGVCAGLGDYFDVDPVFIRIIFLIGLVSAYPFPLLYIVLWILTPYSDVEVKTFKSDKYSDEK